MNKGEKIIEKSILIMAFFASALIFFAGDHVEKKAQENQFAVAFENPQKNEGLEAFGVRIISSHQGAKIGKIEYFVNDERIASNEFTVENDQLKLNISSGKYEEIIFAKTRTENTLTVKISLEQEILVLSKKVYLK